MSVAIFDNRGSLILLCRNAQQARNIVEAMGWRDCQVIWMKPDFSDEAIKGEF